MDEPICIDVNCETGVVETRPLAGEEAAAAQEREVAEQEREAAAESQREAAAAQRIADIAAIRQQFAPAVADAMLRGWGWI